MEHSKTIKYSGASSILSIEQRRKWKPRQAASRTSTPCFEVEASVYMRKSILKISKLYL